MKKNFFYLKAVFFCFLLVLASTGGIAEESPYKSVEDFVKKTMKEAKIPGISLIIINGDDSVYSKGFGYSNLKEKIEVSPETKFELASCSKSFTALAALQLEEKGAINLDDHVSKFFPGFFVNYKEEKQQITLRQLLYHTSGIPASTIKLIPIDSRREALRQIVQVLKGIELANMPGKEYQYATINYDVVGAVIEKVSGKAFEDYMSEYIFKPLGLNNTAVGAERNITGKATGYKIGFFAPREYNAPVYRGNNPAAYVVSNGEDMARWLRIQMGIVKTGLSDLIKKTHNTDQKVVPDRNRFYYYMGWQITNYGKSEIRHAGLNPNFTSYVGFRPKTGIGVVVLANSNSSYTNIIGSQVLRLTAGEEIEEIKPPENKIDAICSIFSIILGIVLLSLLVFLIIKIKGIFRGEKKFAPLTFKTVGKMLLMLLAGLPVYFGIYIFPAAVLMLTWETVIVWGPGSISLLLKFLIALFCLSYLMYLLSLLFPDKNIYRNVIPLVLMLNTVSSLAGLIILPIFMGSFFSGIAVGYILFYFALALSINVLFNKISQTKMILFSNNIALDMRVDLIKKILSSKYQKFEKLLDGRIITTLSNDVVTVTGAVGLFMQFVSNSIVVIAGIVYLATISFAASAFVVLGAVFLGIYYFWISVKARVFLEEARTAQNIATSLMNSMIAGFKELSIHRRKKGEFNEDITGSCNRIRETNIAARLKFLNSEILIGALGTILIGLFCILTPRLLTNINIFVLISLVVVILYIRGPISALIGVLPRYTGVRVSWGRIKQFNEDIDPEEGSYSFKTFFRELDKPRQIDFLDKKELPYIYKDVENIRLEEVFFKYKNVNEEEQFAVGPINFEVNKGEILFITGGNGSGKTTLIKILAGLYEVDSGNIKIDGKQVSHEQLGEQVSAVFSDFYLFKRMYEIDVENKEPEIKEYFKLLELEDKVRLEGDSLSTIDLSGGQKKRLALIQCYLEGRQVFLFDELAANQDPRFREFIYKVLFPRMKEEGKIVIACTHDDHYFDVADKLIKMDMGKIESQLEIKEVVVNSKSDNFIKKYSQYKKK